MRVTRRKLLADLGLGAMMLPLLREPARGAAPPKRLFVIAWTNGCLNFWPTDYSKTDERTFTLPEVLAPLAPHQQDIMIVGGLDLTVAIDDKDGCPGRLHHSLPHLLTGARAYVGPGGTAERGATGNAISLDQHVASAIMKTAPTPIPSLELGLFQQTPYYNQRAVSFRGPVQGTTPQWNQPEISPYKVYQRVFAAGAAGASAGMAVGPADPERLRRTRLDRKSALDFVRAELATASKRLGADDRQKLDQHLAALRSIEQELDALQAASQQGGGCRAPALPDPARVAVDNPNHLPDLAKLQIDIAVAAMACNVTRVATFVMGDAGNDNMTFPFLCRDFLGQGREYGVRSHHDIAHSAYVDPTSNRRKLLTDQWFLSNFAYVLQRMKQIPEGNGTMLDNSLVAIFNTGSEGSSHVMDRLPWVLGGRAGGQLRTGRYVKLGDWAQSKPDRSSKQFPHNGLLVAMANALDAPAKTFGDPQYGGELPGLRG